MPRLFVAVWPPEELVEALRHLDRPRRAGLRWTSEGQWHVTLRFLGELGEDALGGVAAGLALAAGEAAPGAGGVTAVAGPAPRRLGSGVWALPVAGLEGLAEAVRSATAGIGRPPEQRPFAGHLTLARAKDPRALWGLPAPGVACSWRVEELTLVSSELRPEGARYTVVQRTGLRRLGGPG